MGHKRSRRRAHQNADDLRPEDSRSWRQPHAPESHPTPPRRDRTSTVAAVSNSIKFNGCDDRAAAFNHPCQKRVVGGSASIAWVRHSRGAGNRHQPQYPISEFVVDRVVDVLDPNPVSCLIKQLGLPLAQLQPVGFSIRTNVID